MSITSDVTYPTHETLVREFKEDLELRAIDAGIAAPPLQPGSDWDLLAVATANRASVAIAAVQTLDNDSNPLVASGEPLNELLRADGHPEVAPAPGAGQITAVVSGVATINAGLKFQAAGMKGTVTDTIVDASSGNVALNVVMDSTGPLTNLAAGTKVRFMNQPANIATEATVIATFTGGTGAESEERKRLRLLTGRRDPPAGGNYSQYILEALNASGAIADAVAYPALGGPASIKIALTSNTSAGNREVSDNVLELVRARYREKFPQISNKIVVESAINVMTDVALGLRLPTSGSGIWLAHGPVAPTVMINSTSATQFRVQTLIGSTLGVEVGDVIAGWTGVDTKFSTARVTSVTPVVAPPANAWDIETELWSGPTPTFGWISPACEGLNDIATAWLDEMLKLGPGEMLASTDPRFTFARRHPDVTDGSPMELTARQTGALQAKITDIIRAEYVYVTPSAAPAVPALVSDRPQVLCARRFGVYPL